MTTVRRLTLAAALVLLLGLATATTAGAAPPTSPRCVRLADRVELYQATRDQLTALVTRTQTRLASGSLRANQARAARMYLASLQFVLARTDVALGRLQSRYTTSCSGPGGDPAPAPEPDPEPVPTIPYGE